MRVLWLDANQNPWTDTNGFTLLEEFGIRVDRVHDCKIANGLIQQANFDLLVVSAELEGALDLLIEVKRHLRKLGKKIILCSSVWTKENFKQHSKTAGAANRYARLPMPVEGFLGVAAELCECPVTELKNFPEPHPPLESEVPSLKFDTTNIQEAGNAPEHAQADDIEVLRKYLRMREEQLELLSSEREELHQDNGVLRKELHKLEQKLRESSGAQFELAKKMQHAEGELASVLENKGSEKEHLEQEIKLNQEKLKVAESKLRESEERCEELRLRVRKDIRKIRANERELEARLEILRKDSATLLAAREQKVLELQRKIDALEFDLDQVQDSRVQAEMESERYVAKLSRVTRALHIAIGVIEEDQIADEELDALEPMLGGAALDTENAAMAAEAPPMEEVEPEASDHEQVDHYAALAADGEPTRVIQSSDLIDPSDSDGNQAAG